MDCQADVALSRNSRPTMPKANRPPTSSPSDRPRGMPGTNKTDYTKKAK